MLTVRQLIAILEHHDPDAIVCVEVTDDPALKGSLWAEGVVVDEDGDVVITI